MKHIIGIVTAVLIFMAGTSVKVDAEVTDTVAAPSTTTGTSISSDTTAALSSKITILTTTTTTETTTATTHWNKLTCITDPIAAVTNTSVTLNLPEIPEGASSLLIESGSIKTNSTTITGLSPGTTYLFHIYSSKGNVKSNDSCTVNVTTNRNKLTCITDPIAAVTNTSVTLNLPEIPEGASSLLIESGSIKTNSTTITGLSPGTTYLFHIYSSKGNVKSNDSCTVNVTTNRNKLTCITDPIAAVTNTSVTLNLPEIPEGASSLLIESGSIKTNSTTITGLSPGTTYLFHIYSSKGNVKSNDSCTVNVTTNRNKLTCITDPIAAVTNTSVTLNLPEIPEGASSLLIESGSIKTNSTTITGLSPGTTYLFHIYSSKGNVKSNDSCTVNVTTNINNPSCRSDSIASVTNTSVTLILPEIPTGASSLQIVSDPELSGLPRSNQNKSTTIKGLSPGMTYLFYIYSSKGNVKSNNSCTVKVTTNWNKLTCITKSITAVTNTSVTLDLPEVPIGAASLQILSHPELSDLPRNTQNKSTTITALSPGTTYLLYIYSSKGNVKSNDSCTVKVTTKPAAPLSVNIIQVDDSKNFTVQWKLNPNQNKDLISSYKVIAIDTKNNKTKTHIQHGNSQEKTLIDLSPGRCYYIKVIVVANNVSGYPRTSDEYKCTSPVLTCSKGVFVNVTSNGFVLNLTLLHSEGVNNFEVELVQSHHDERKTPTDGVVEYNNLDAGKKYTVIIHAYGVEEKSNFKCSVEHFTKPDNPVCSQSIVNNLLENINSTGMKFNAASLNTKGAVQYNVKVLQGNKPFSNETVTNSSQHPYSTMKPGTNYTFTIQAVGENGQYSDLSCSVWHFTNPTEPKDIVIENTTVNGFGLSWTWNDNDYYETFTVHIVNKQSMNMSTFKDITEKSTIVSTLHAGQCYDIEVYAVIQNQTGAPASTTNHCTIPAKPSVLVKARNDSVVFTVNSVMGHVDFYRLAGKCVFPNGTTEAYNKKYGNSTRLAISYLGPGTCCTFNLYAVLLNFESEAFVSKEIHLNETVPGTVRDLKIRNVNSTELSLWWTPPAVKHGVITKYTLDITDTTYSKSCMREYEISATYESAPCSLKAKTKKWTKQETLTTTTTSSKTSNCDENEINGNFSYGHDIFNVSFTGLHPYTVYNISIRAFTSAGPGDTKVMLQRTNEDIPGKPVNVTAISSNATSMTIHWDPPLEPNGVITEYYISYHFINNSLKSQSDVQHKELFNLNGNITVDNQTLGLTIDELYYWSYYKFCVNASTKIGNGEWTCVEGRTEEYVPTSDVMNLTVDHKDYQSVTISFTAPQYPNGIITGYLVKYTYKKHVCIENINNAELLTKTEDDVNLNLLVGSTVVYTVNNLFSYWSYTFTVLPKTKKGNGTVWSSNLTTMTNNSIPGPIRIPTGDNSHNHVYPNITSSSISIEWKEPCYPKGIITQYHIRLSNEKPDVETTRNFTHWQQVGLQPYTNYNICIAAENNVGMGSCANLPPVMTLVDVPYKPTQVVGTAKTFNSVKVNWNKPTLCTGPTNYIVNAFDIVSKKTTQVCETHGYQNTSCIAQGLDEFWDYTFTVTAITSKGRNISEASVVVKTKPSTPGKVTNLNITLQTDISKPRSISLSWNPPSVRDRNGVITSYVVSFNGTVLKGENSTILLNHTNLNNFLLQPEECYAIQVIAKTSVGKGIVSQVDKCMPAGAPVKPMESTTNLLMQEGQSSAVEDSEKQIAVKLPLEFLCSTENGKPVKWGIIVSEAAQVGNEKSFIGKKDDYIANRLPKYKTWSQVHDNDAIAPYIATPNSWKPDCKVRRKREINNQQPSQTLIIGKSGECEGVAGNCNGYLQPGKSYRVKSYVCTDGGCTETYYSKPISTDPNLVPAIAGGISSAVIVLLVIAVVMFILRRRNAVCFKGKDNSVDGDRDGADNNAYVNFEMETKKNRRDEHNYKLDLPLSTAANGLPEIDMRPIKLAEFERHFHYLSANSNMQFSEEYKALKHLSPAHPTEAAFRHVSKNRYTNILPFDHSRVKLLPLSDDCDESTDFINANYIPGYNSPREFIASQGPVESTTDEFWRMIWEQNVAIIVMLTQCMERGRVKCFKYWPDEVNEPVFYGDIIITIEKEAKYPDYILRTINLRLGDYKKKVRHFAYSAWPDMGCPETPTALLSFVKQVRQAVPADMNGPITVHCSAGVGRTGTFIVVDDLLHQIDNGCTEIDIFGLVLQKRDHRTNMVQTEDQYVYIHECIKEYIIDEDDVADGGHEDPLYENL